MRIVSGGQTGADRAALDVAIELGLPFGGRVPSGGWAEDLPDPPGLLARYPGLIETPGRDPAERTRLNVRDSDATLILLARGGPGASAGTRLTRQTALALGRPCLVIEADRPDAEARVRAWLASLGPLQALNVAGPRESEAPGLYAAAAALLRRALAPGPAPASGGIS